MTSEADSRVQGRAVWQRRLRRLRFFRLPLVIALVLIGAGAARVSLARLGASPDRVVATPASPSARQAASQAETLLAERTKTSPVREVTDASQADAPAKPIVETPEPPVDDTSEPADGELATVDTVQRAEKRESPRRSIDASQAREAAARFAAECRSSFVEDWARLGSGARQVAAWAGSLIPEASRLVSDLRPDEGQRPNPSSQGAPETEATFEMPVEPDAVVLVNPVDSGGAVRFVVDGEVFALKPGESHRLTSHGPCVVQFHRGGNFGNAEYTIGEGMYAFHVSSAGWELRRVGPQARP